MIFAAGLFAQGGNTVMLTFAGAPTGTCAQVMLARNDATGGIYSCTAAGAWQLISTVLPATSVKTDQSNTYSTGTQSFASATALIVRTGSGAPAATGCDAAAEIGSLYMNTAATNWTGSLYECVQAGAGVYGWQLVAPVAGAGISITAAATGWTLLADTAVMESRAGAQSMTSHSCIDAGANDTYACDIVPALAAYPATTNLLYVVLTPNTANTGAASLNVQGKGAKPIYKNADGTDLADNDLRAGIPILLKWDAGSNSGNGAFFVEGQLGNAGSGATANQKIGSFGATFDGGGASLVVGTKAYTRVPFACTVTSWSVIVDTGTVTVDVWRQATAATDLPAIGDEIAGTDHPAIAANNVVKAAAGAWTSKAIAADDVVAFNIDAASGVTYLQVVIECDKS